MDWSFLKPWAADIERVVLYRAREEVDYATLHDRVDFIAFQLSDLDVFAGDQTADERWEELSCLREGLELLALAVHYDRYAWQYFHDHSWISRLEMGFPFELRHPHVQAHWQLCFHDSMRRNSSDSEIALRAGVDMLTRMPQRVLSAPYHKAKSKIRKLVGEAWDDAYRVPVSLSFAAPDIDEDATAWLSVVHELVRSLNDPAGCTGDSFRLGPIMLSLGKLPMMDFTSHLLLTLFNAHAHLPELTLMPAFNDTASIAQTINDAAGICPVDTEPEEQFVDNLVLRGSGGDAQFAGCCSAVARARSLGGLTLDKAFTDKTPDVRSSQWRWLGYALSNRHWTSSVRILKIKEEYLTRGDAEQLVARRYLDRTYDPPNVSPDDQPRTVLLAAKSLICLNSGETEPLERLGFTNADEFLVLGDEDDAEWMAVLVPGYGPCRVACTSIVDARVLTRPSREQPTLRSLNLHLDRCEPDALPTITAHFGSTLTSLNIAMKDNLVLNAVQLRSVLRTCPALRFLSLRRVHIGSMDVVLDAYRAKECRLETLSLWNAWVQPPSLTRFAFELADADAIMNCYLREFRFNYDDLEDDDVRLVDDDTVTAFVTMLEFNQSLIFFEIALEEALHAVYMDRFLALDGTIEVRAIPRASKIAFLGVVTGVEQSTEEADTSIRRKRRRAIGHLLPSVHREAIVRRIWGFVTPVETIARTVSATLIQAE